MLVPLACGLEFTLSQSHMSLCLVNNNLLLCNTMHSTALSCSSTPRFQIAARDHVHTQPTRVNTAVSAQAANLGR